MHTISKCKLTPYKPLNSSLDWVSFPVWVIVLFGGFLAPMTIKFNLFYGKTYNRASKLRVFALPCGTPEKKSLFLKPARVAHIRNVQKGVVNFKGPGCFPAWWALIQSGDEHPACPKLVRRSLGPVEGLGPLRVGARTTLLPQNSNLRCPNKVKLNHYASIGILPSRRGTKEPRFEHRGTAPNDSLDYGHEPLDSRPVSSCACHLRVPPALPDDRHQFVGFGTPLRFCRPVRPFPSFLRQRGLTVVAVDET